MPDPGSWPGDASGEPQNSARARMRRKASPIPSFPQRLPRPRLTRASPSWAGLKHGQPMPWVPVCTNLEARQVGWPETLNMWASGWVGGSGLGWARVSGPHTQLRHKPPEGSTKLGRRRPTLARSWLNLAWIRPPWGGSRLGVQHLPSACKYNKTCCIQKTYVVAGQHTFCITHCKRLQRHAQRHTAAITCCMAAALGSPDAPEVPVPLVEQSRMCNSTVLAGALEKTCCDATGNAGNP